MQHHPTALIGKDIRIIRLLNLMIVTMRIAVYISLYHPPSFFWMNTTFGIKEANHAEVEQEAMILFIPHQQIGSHGPNLKGCLEYRAFGMLITQL